MQIEYQEKDEKNILDVISSCQPVSDGRNQRDNDRKIKLIPPLVILRLDILRLLQVPILLERRSERS